MPSPQNSVTKNQEYIRNNSEWDQ